MAFELPTLPYAQDALEPHISARTLSFHHGKHHQAYVNKTNELIAGTELEGKSLKRLPLPSRLATRRFSTRQHRYGTIPSSGTA